VSAYLGRRNLLREGRREEISTLKKKKLTNNTTNKAKPQKNEIISVRKRGTLS
jgi:hypothetical protein